MNVPSISLTSCDKEPIHIPGSIQPHGILLIVDRATGTIIQGAGDIEGRLGVATWQGQALASLFGGEIAAAILQTDPILPRHIRQPHSDQSFDISVIQGQTDLIIELEPAAPVETIHSLLPKLERAADLFEKASDLETLLARAAHEFRRLTDYDRVMVYQFLEDGTGKVMAESTASGQKAFLNHHFPASDIPLQARQLYLRNLSRVIPDAAYEAAPLRPPSSAQQALDMSDCSLRSVSPIHLKYLRNMGVAASASFSILKEGQLWGLIACHNASPKMIARDVRNACRALGATLSRQIKAWSDTELYRERVRLRSLEDQICGLLLQGGALDRSLTHHLEALQDMLRASGIAIRRGAEIIYTGRVPPAEQISALSDWLVHEKRQRIFATSALATTGAPSDASSAAFCAGLLAMTLSADEPWVVMWFRAEVVEIINWAGNPHKLVSDDEHGTLSPRASFQSWCETVSGKAEPWSAAELEAAERLAGAIQSISQTHQIQNLNKELSQLVHEKDGLLKQREFLLAEVSHRVQNSLTLVSAFLSMQARKTSELDVKHALEQARHRISAVSMVHRRLYSTNEVRMVDAARYIDELLNDILETLGEDWRARTNCELQAVIISNDRAISIGLILTELIINANKYAYDGKPGALNITLRVEGGELQLVVADNGKGLGNNAHRGFGSQMMDACVIQLEGNLSYHENGPGTKAVLLAPIFLNV